MIWLITAGIIKACLQPHRAFHDKGQAEAYFGEREREEPLRVLMPGETHVHWAVVEIPLDDAT